MPIYWTREARERDESLDPDQILDDRRLTAADRAAWYRGCIDGARDSAEHHRRHYHGGHTHEAPDHGGPYGTAYRLAWSQIADAIGESWADSVAAQREYDRSDYGW